MNRKLQLFVLLILFSLAAQGQDTDFGLWYEVNAECKIVKGIRADFEGSVRTDNNASHVESFYFEPGLRFKVTDNISAGIYYRFIEQDEGDGIYYARHRWFVQFKGDLPVARFNLSARYRLQEQFRTYIENSEDEIPAWSHRLKLEASYDVRGLPLVPFVSAEFNNRIFTANGVAIEKVRYIAGVEYIVNKKHTFGLSYIYNTSKVSNPDYLNVIAVKYGIKIR